jgi:nucleoside-diphosphate-sugar epimerase
MRVLITGGAGFFGSRAALHFPGHDVHLVDQGALPWSRPDALGVTATRHQVDLMDAAATRELLLQVRPDVVVHLAWYAVPGQYLTSSQNFAHVTAATSLFMAAKEAGCTRFCGAGTCFEYDTSVGVLREDSPTRPIHLYSAAKLATYLMLERAAALHEVSFAWMRFFFPYGPLEAPGRLFSHTVSELLAGRPAKTTPGEQIRDFMHVDDIGRAVALIATSNVTGIINVGSGVPVTVRDAVSAIAEATGRKDLLELGAMPYRAGDPMHVQADASRLRALGFAPQFDLASGVRDTVGWARREQSSSTVPGRAG